MIRNFILGILILIPLLGFSSEVDTLSFFSKATNSEKSVVVITPETYSNSKVHYPVVYLLHGHGGTFGTWLLRVPSLQRLADEFNAIIVCPDGGFDSWYLNSPLIREFQYESHIVNEVIPFIDSKFRTIADRKGRAITGLSMGGHGGLYLGLKHQDLFIAMGSMSGGVDLRPFPDNWNIKKYLGEQKKYMENWEKYSVINNLDLYNFTLKTSIIFDCGTEDFFLEVNNNLHKSMMEKKIPHEYTVRPGSHNWDYWRNSLYYHMVFFNNKFQ